MQLQHVTSHQHEYIFLLAPTERKKYYLACTGSTERLSHLTTALEDNHSSPVDVLLARQGGPAIPSSSSSLCTYPFAAEALLTLTCSSLCSIPALLLQQQCTAPQDPASSIIQSTWDCIHMCSILRAPRAPRDVNDGAAADVRTK